MTNIFTGSNRAQRCTKIVCAVLTDGSVYQPWCFASIVMKDYLVLNNVNQCSPPASLRINKNLGKIVLLSKKIKVRILLSHGVYHLTLCKELNFLGSQGKVVSWMHLLIEFFRWPRLHISLKQLCQTRAPPWCSDCVVVCTTPQATALTKWIFSV